MQGDPLAGFRGDFLREQVTDGVWKSTFQGIRPVGADDNRLVISVPNGMVADRIHGRYRSLVDEALLAASGTALDLVVEVHPVGDADSTTAGDDTDSLGGDASGDGLGPTVDDTLQYGACWILFMNTDGTVKSSTKISRSSEGLISSAATRPALAALVSRAAWVGSPANSWRPSVWLGAVSLPRRPASRRPIGVATRM